MLPVEQDKVDKTVAITFNIMNPSALASRYTLRRGVAPARGPGPPSPGARSYPMVESALMWWRRSARLSPITSRLTRSKRTVELSQSLSVRYAAAILSKALRSGFSSGMPSPSLPWIVHLMKTRSSSSSRAMKSILVDHHRLVTVACVVRHIAASVHLDLGHPYLETVNAVEPFG